MTKLVLEKADHNGRIRHTAVLANNTVLSIGQHTLPDDRAALAFLFSCWELPIGGSKPVNGREGWYIRRIE